MRQRAILATAIFLGIVAFAFGRAVLNGDYFGACDHAAGTECEIVHVLGVVMHRDVEEPLSAQHYREEEERAAGRPQREAEAERERTDP